MTPRDNSEFPAQENEQPSNEERSSTYSTLSSIVSGVSTIASDVSSYWTRRFYDAFLSSRDPQAYYKHTLEVATSFEQWCDAANNLDMLQGNDQWKNDFVSPDYDYDLLMKRLSQLKKARKSGELSQMIFLLRTSLARNLGDMGRRELYAYTNIGTKNLIENYIREVVKQMDMICERESEEISTKAKLEFFTNTRQSFGRTALLLSGGATFGLAHIGVIKCLHENDLLPRIISGTSSGSIIAALLCTKTDDEIPITLKAMNSGGFDLEVFEKNSNPDTWYIRLCRFLRQGVIFDVDILRDCMRRNIPDMTFQEAYNRTRKILNITVSSSTAFEMPHLLNYLTAPDVLIWSAVAASCSVPFVYSSSPLMAKNKSGDIVQWTPSGHRWIDGSVQFDLPMKKLSELFNVNHFIVCQVNPHVVPFLERKIIPSPITRFVAGLLNLATSELGHRLNQLSEIGIMPDLMDRIGAIMSQQYNGDITIVPNPSYADFLKILSNPTPELLQEAILRGERATWLKMSIIKNHCRIEFTIDQILYRLRLRQLEDTFTEGIEFKTESDSTNSQPERRNRDSRHKVQPLSTNELAPNVD